MLSTLESWTLSASGVQHFRQHPLDYLESLEKCITTALAELTEEQKDHVIGIGVDTTGSTPVPVDKNGTPLALLDEFAENENAMFFLWKDHAAAAEADEINKLFRNNSENDYTKYQGDTVRNGTGQKSFMQ